MHTHMGMILMQEGWVLENKELHIPGNVGSQKTCLQQADLDTRLAVAVTSFSCILK